MLAIPVIHHCFVSGSSQGSALGVLNNLHLAVTLIFIGILLLLTAHWYIRRESALRRLKDKKKGRRFGRDDDMVFQFEVMTREELKEMIHKERAAKAEAAKGQKEMKAGDTPAADLTPAAPSPVMPTDTEEPVSEADDAPGRLPDEASPADVPERRPAPPRSRDAVLLAHLAMEDGDDEKGSGGKKETPKSKYSDLVERSILSNELPEEFRNKSRKI